MKTLSQIAKENGISKNKLYRYATKHCNDMQRTSKGAMLLDATQESLVLGLLLENEVHQEQQGATHQCNSNATDINELLATIKTQYEGENLFLKQQIEVLNKELEIKNNQIQDLMEIQRANQVLLHQAAEPKQLPDHTVIDTKKRLFARLFKL